MSLPTPTIEQLQAQMKTLQDQLKKAEDDRKREAYLAKKREAYHANYEANKAAVLERARKRRERLIAEGKVERRPRGRPRKYPGPAAASSPTQNTE